MSNPHFLLFFLLILCPGLAGQVTPYGVPTPGEYGEPKVRMTGSNKIGSGYEMTIHLDGAPPDTLCYLLVGTRREIRPLPGITLNTFPFWTLAARTSNSIVSPAGHAAFLFPVPTDKSLIGTALCFQWLAEETSALGGLCGTKGLEVRFEKG